MTKLTKILVLLGAAALLTGCAPEIKDNVPYQPKGLVDIEPVEPAPLPAPTPRECDSNGDPADGEDGICEIKQPKTPRRSKLDSTSCSALLLDLESREASLGLTYTHTQYKMRGGDFCAPDPENEENCLLDEDGYFLKVELSTEELRDLRIFKQNQINELVEGIKQKGCEQ